jgi:hypothetical protein
VIAALLAAALAAGAPAEAVTVIVGATLVDAGGKAPRADAIVVVRGARIAEVGDRARTAIPKGATLVDGRRAWIAPAPEAPPEDLAGAIAAILREPRARVRAGEPAHLALLDGDPRAGRAKVRRVWTAGKPRE